MWYQPLFSLFEEIPWRKVIHENSSASPQWNQLTRWKALKSQRLSIYFLLRPCVFTSLCPLRRKGIVEVVPLKCFYCLLCSGMTNRCASPAFQFNIKTQSGLQHFREFHLICLTNNLRPRWNITMWLRLIIIDNAWSKLINFVRFNRKSLKFLPKMGTN